MKEYWQGPLHPLALRTCVALLKQEDYTDGNNNINIAEQSDSEAVGVVLQIVDQKQIWTKQI